MHSTLVPPEHRIQVLHPVSVLGLILGTYVKSSKDGFFYICFFSYPEDVLQIHMSELISIVTSVIKFLYKESPVYFRSFQGINYRHFQDQNEFVCSVLQWKNVDMYIRKNGFFLNRAFITSVLHAFWSKLKSFVAFMLY